MTDQYLTEHDLAKLLSVELDDIKNWIDHGIITKEAFIKVGDSYRFEKEKTLHALHNTDTDSLTPYEELREDFISRLQEMELYKLSVHKFFEAFTDKIESFMPDDFWFNQQPTMHLIEEASELKKAFPGKESLFDDFLRQVELTNFEGFNVGQKLYDLCGELGSDYWSSICLDDPIGWPELTTGEMTFEELAKQPLFEIEQESPLKPCVETSIHNVFDLIAWFEAPEEITSKPESATVVAIHKTWIEVDTKYETGGRIPKFRLEKEDGSLPIKTGDELTVVVEKSPVKFTN